MIKIAVERGSSWAPCSYIVCKVSGEPGSYDWNERDESSTVLFQTDWDRPGLASAFGFVPCDCGDTDGTVNCAHKTAGEMIEAASDYLDMCADEGRVVEDPGYFD